MYNQKFLIHKFTHFFVVYLTDLRYQRLVYEFTSQFVDYVKEYDPQRRLYVEKPRVWAGRLVDNSSFRFPIGVLNKFEKFLQAKNVHSSEIQYKVEQTYLPARAVFALADIYEPRDYQTEAVNYALANRNQGAPSTLIQMPPGSGKTVVMAYILQILQLRAALIIPPTYMEKWLSDAVQYLNLEDKDVYQVSGAKSIRKAVDMAEADEFNRKFTIISIKTFGEFLKSYESDPKGTIAQYGTDPISFWETLKIGVLGGDESHEMFFAMNWLHTTIHGPFHLALSATMLDSNPFIEERQKAIYPCSIRFDKIKMKRYIHMHNVDYKFGSFDKDRIKTSYPRNKSYSQNAFEESIFKNHKVLKNFLEMIEWGVNTFFYHRTNQSSDKLGIYFASVKMLNIVVEFLKHKFPGVDIRRFVGEDPYINLIDPTIRCTTQGSGGTGKDIKNLTSVLNFNCMRSRKGNIQLLGRIREIEGREDLYFVQFNCLNIKKHQQYKMERNQELKDKTKTLSQRFYGVPL